MKSPTEYADLAESCIERSRENGRAEAKAMLLAEAQTWATLAQVSVAAARPNLALVAS